jgi:hypothetical protein
MNLEWNSEEVNRDYPLWWNKGPFSYAFNESESLILEKAKAKYLAYKKNEPLSARERVAKNLFKGEKADRVPILSMPGHTATGRMYDAFAPAPSVLNSKDMVNYPNLDFLAQVMWLAKFPHTDIMHIYNYGFGEELVTRKFRFIENGPPLAVEPFVKTKADAQFFVENVPEPALRAGTWPAYFWEVKTLTKLIPECPNKGSVCGGPVTMAGFLRGIKDLVTDIRNNDMEMVQLLFKGTVELLKKKIDRQIECLGGKYMDESGEGNLLIWCDSTSYLSAADFEKVFDYTYVPAIDYVTNKGWATEVIPEGPLTAHKKIAKIMGDNLGGGLLGFSEHPTIEEWYQNTRQYSNVWANDAFSGAAIANPDYQKAIEEEYERHRKIVMAPGNDGVRTVISQPGSNPTYKLEAIEFAVKTMLTKFKIQ